MLVGFWLSFSPSPPGMCHSQTLTVGSKHLHTDGGVGGEACLLEQVSVPLRWHSPLIYPLWDFWASLLPPVSLLFPHIFAERVNTWAALPMAVRTSHHLSLSWHPLSQSRLHSPGTNPDSSPHRTIQIPFSSGPTEQNSNPFQGTQG